MIEQHVLKTPLHLVKQSYWQDYESKLVAIQDGSGRGRDGMQDGWIERGVSNYRPFLKGNAEDVFGTTEIGPFSREDISDALEAVIAELMLATGSTTLEQVIINRMAPGAKLAWHIDGAPYYRRYHVPILTDGVMFYEGEQRIMMYEGFWYGPISYWLPHMIENNTLHERVHAIIDFGPELTP